MAQTAEKQPGETTVGRVKMTQSVTLAVPFHSPVDQREITNVTIRRPKVKDQLNHMVDDELSATGLVHMMADLIEGFTPQDIGEMDSADFNVLRDILFDFLGITPLTPEAATASSG